MKWWVVALFLVACGPRDGRHKPLAGAATEPVGYDKVKPLFAKHCASCHPSRSGPDWLDYTQASAAARSGKLADRVWESRSTARAMPPPSTAEAAAMDEKDRRLIAQWARSGALLNTPGSAAGPAGDSGEVAAQSCFQCHGSTGPGSEPKAARLAGQNEKYLVVELTRFKWRERLDPTGRMNDAARGLSAETIAGLARYFSSLPNEGGAVALAPEKRELFNRGRELAQMYCNTCHMRADFAGRPASDWLPVLRHQSKTYLIDQLLYFKNRERSNSVMYEFVRDLSHGDMEAVTLYYSAGGDGVPVSSSGIKPW